MQVLPSVNVWFVCSSILSTFILFTVLLFWSVWSVLLRIFAMYSPPFSFTRTVLFSENMVVWYIVCWCIVKYVYCLIV